MLIPKKTKIECGLTQKEVETKPNKEKTHPKPSPLDRPLLFRYMQNYDEKDESNEDKESDEDDS